MFGVENAGRINTLMPVSYQGWVLGASAVAVFILAHSVVHQQSRWAQPHAARRARAVGDLALGVYATHQVVLIALMRVRGHNLPHGATTMPQLILVCAATLLGAVMMTMVIKRIPLLRRSV